MEKTAVFIMLTTDKSVLSDGAMLVNKAASLGVSRIVWGMSGFDNDPRELDSIPESREALQFFSRLLDDRAYNLLDEQCKAMLCLCTGEARRIEGGKIEVDVMFRGDW